MSNVVCHECAVSFGQIHTRHARHHHRRDFVIVRAEFGGHVFGAKMIVTLRADQHDFITEFHVGNVRHVDDALIHTHPTDIGARQPRTNTSPQLFGLRRKPSAYPIGITAIRSYPGVTYVPPYETANPAAMS